MLPTADIETKAAKVLSEFETSPSQSSEPRLSSSELAAMIDHTALKPDTTLAMISHLCDEARGYGFASVCVNSTNVSRCVELLGECGIPVCSVVGFPLGASLSPVKAFEATRALELGAQEIDMVMNIGALKATMYDNVSDDIAAVSDKCHARGALLKVIIEACLLTDLEKVTACLLAVEAGADYVKTSTGFSTGGATLEDVRLLRHVVGSDVGVKAAGGIRSYGTAVDMVAAGASRIGASAGIQIIQGAGTGG